MREYENKDYIVFKSIKRMSTWTAALADVMAYLETVEMILDNALRAG